MHPYLNEKYEYTTNFKRALYIYHEVYTLFLLSMNSIILIITYFYLFSSSFAANAYGNSPPQNHHPAMYLVQNQIIHQQPSLYQKTLICLALEVPLVALPHLFCMGHSYNNHLLILFRKHSISRHYLTCLCS